MDIGEVNLSFRVGVIGLPCVKSVDDEVQEGRVTVTTILQDGSRLVVTSHHESGNHSHGNGSVSEPLVSLGNRPISSTAINSPSRNQPLSVATEFPFSDDTKFVHPATDSPEEIGVGGSGRSDDGARRKDDLCGDDLVDRKALLLTSPVSDSLIKSAGEAFSCTKNDIPSIATSNGHTSDSWPRYASAIESQAGSVQVIIPKLAK